MLTTTLGRIKTTAWCSLTNRHISITLSFLVVGHTKFALDWCFGLCKRHYRQTKVGSLKAIAKAANDSADCNFAQLVIVPTYDGTGFFPLHFKRVARICDRHISRKPR